VAECAKVIENTQRDVNIALMNEVARICERINLRTSDVIEAAATKWNFLKFRPGLVGGHCIGVDPYYLAALAQDLGLAPDVILSARQVNDGMADHVAQAAIARLRLQRGTLAGARVGLFGVTFKEDVPDIRNSKSFDLIRALEAEGVILRVHDPLAQAEDVAEEGVELCALAQMTGLDMMVVAVAHRDYLAPGFVTRHLRPDGVLIDVKSVLAGPALPRTISYWSL
jgi:UDP-N-acetyl-D-glucosamine/UDP-N-acetyl-D-galactosamine dehydrogenase